VPPIITDECLPQQGNIMIVDDNPSNLKLLEDMLREHGYEIRSFPRGGWLLRQPTRRRRT
jgi:CheY-like chemotaxis protein